MESCLFVEQKKKKREKNDIDEQWQHINVLFIFFFFGSHLQIVAENVANENDIPNFFLSNSDYSLLAVFVLY